MGQGVEVKSKTSESSLPGSFRELGEDGSADVQSGVPLSIAAPATMVANEHPAHPASAILANATS
ncbi:MAG: hypothetical protein L3K13_08115, partial [Thermoplasmata archaeon]|nr:hypothetical protein [Thermoplasmata archaeon]